MPTIESKLRICRRIQTGTANAAIRNLLDTDNIFLHDAIRNLSELVATYRDLAINKSCDRDGRAATG
jgi:hypothetical protein